MATTIIQEDIATIANHVQEVAKRLSGKTVLITGGAGFLGNYFIDVFEHLGKTQLAKPIRVISVDNFVTGVRYRRAEGPFFRVIQHDIKNPIAIDEDVHFIIHAAGIASPKFYRSLKIETIDVATMGTKNMLELAHEKKVESMLFFSSSEVYGDPDPNFVPTPETYWGNVSCTGPRANYDESKRLGETLCVAYFETYGVPVKMVRPFNVYGPGMRLDDYRVIPNFAAAILNKQPLQVYGTGNQTRTFCYITDGITGFLRTLLTDSNGQSFNIGTDRPEINMLALASIMAELYPGSTVNTVEGPNDAYSKGDPQRRCPDLSKSRRLLAYEPRVDLRTGLQRFMTWAQEVHAAGRNV